MLEVNVKLKHVKTEEDMKAFIAGVVQKQDENYRAAMAKIKRTDERASIAQCPVCSKPHNRYKVRYDSDDVAFVMCGTAHCRIDLNANWIVTEDKGAV